MTAAILLIGLVLTACGVPRNDSATVIAESALPSDLREGSLPTPIPEEDARLFQVWFVGPANRLESVSRDISFTGEAFMNSLLAGTFPVEVERDITSAIPRTLAYNQIVIDTDQGIAFLDLLAGSIQGGARGEQALAFGQIVYTLTGLPVSAVVFSADGELIPVPSTDRGTLPPGVGATRQDFASLDPRNTVFVTEEGTGIVPDTFPTPVIVAPVGDETVDLAIFMMTETGQLVPVERRIERSPEAIVASLLLGPESSEASRGLISALTPNAVALNLDVDERPDSATARTAFLDLASGSLPPVTDERRPWATAQIVYSLTELNEIDRVIITEDGAPTALITDAGVAALEVSLGRQDYLSLTEPPDEADGAAGADAVAGTEEGDPDTPTPTPTPTQEP